jgi:ABC-type nickel/cobalt efflux system permease component RcnA
MSGPGPNSTLSAWQLAIMAVVIVASLAVWLIAVYLADREPRRHDRAGAVSPGRATDAAAAGIAAAVASEHQPARQARSAKAA